MNFTHGSTFSGIEGMGLGLERAGWDCLWNVEKDPECREVLSQHWPGIPQHDDVRTLQGAQVEPVVLLAGGWPCQGNSAAGRRQGLSDDRSSLFWELARLISEVKPQYFILENVPGLLSVNKGADFLIVLDTLQALGYAVDLDLLDAQFFGVPQRRRRLFFIGARLDVAPDPIETSRDQLVTRHLKRWDGQLHGMYGTERPNDQRSLAEVLESPSSDLKKYFLTPTACLGILRRAKKRNRKLPPPLRAALVRTVATYSTKPEQHAELATIASNYEALAAEYRGRNPDVVAALSAAGVGVSGPDDNQAQAGHLIPVPDVFEPELPEVSGTLGSGSGRRGWCDDLDRAGVFIPYPDETAYALSAPAHGPRYDLESENFAYVEDHHVVSGASDPILTKNLAQPLTCRKNYDAFNYQGFVRRLTPMECERLQGLPDEWTLKGDGRAIADSARYRMIGNAVAVPCAQWVATKVKEMANG